jgi:hypothetical protein
MKDRDQSRDKSFLRLRDLSDGCDRVGAFSMKTGLFRRFQSADKPAESVTDLECGDQLPISKR